MALHGNMNVFNKNPALSLSGQSLAFDRPQSCKNGSWRNVYSGDFNLGFQQKNATPSGYVPPYCYKIALASGGLATFRFVTGNGEIVNVNLAGGLGADALLSGSGDVTNAAGALIVTAVAAIVGAGDLTADIAGKLEAAATLLGAGDLTAALGAIADALATLSGTGTIAATPFATGTITADITVSGEALTTANVASAIWDALAASFNTPGTMGNKLNSASAAGDPWTALLPGSYAPGEAGYIVGTNLDAAVSTLSTSAQAALILKILRNKTVTDPATGLMTVYDDDGVSVLFTANIFQDAGGTTPYDGNGINLRDRLT